eukprot:SAG31_NODE_1566_length_7856_cov_8.045607_8_plen_160_part_00
MLAGWRSWNAFGNEITEQTFYGAIDAITEKKFQVDGANVSLADVGYDSVGIDEVCLSLSRHRSTVNCTQPTIVLAARSVCLTSGVGGLRTGLQCYTALRQRHTRCERVQISGHESARRLRALKGTEDGVLLQRLWLWKAVSLESVASQSGARGQLRRRH